MLELTDAHNLAPSLLEDSLDEYIQSQVTMCLLVWTMM